MKKILKNTTKNNYLIKNICDELVEIEDRSRSNLRFDRFVENETQTLNKSKVKAK